MDLATTCVFLRPVDLLALSLHNFTVHRVVERCKVFQRHAWIEACTAGVSRSSSRIVTRHVYSHYVVPPHVADLR